MTLIKANNAANRELATRKIQALANKVAQLKAKLAESMPCSLS